MQTSMDENSLQFFNNATENAVNKQRDKSVSKMDNLWFREHKRAKIERKMVGPPRLERGTCRL